MTRQKESSTADVYLTGFEPFGGMDYNPSWEVAKGCASVLEQDHSVYTECLPVTFSLAGQWGVEHLGQREDDLVLHFGLASTRSYLSLEQVARAQTSSMPDNDGERLALDRFSAGSELTTTLDLASLADALTREHAAHTGANGGSLPEVRVTQDAGNYVCNAIYYHSLCAHPAGRVVFVHVPMQTSEVARLQGELLAKALLTIDVGWSKF